ncbi:MAG: hypothetical protein ACAH83_15910, partial [Alphaproteobacteria bacterium]
TIFGYKNLPAVAYVLKSTPSSALNGHLQRTPDGFIKNFRQLDMSDPKNLRAFESAIDRQILKARKTVAGGTSFISSFIHWDDKFRRSEDAKIELRQLERARADLEKFKKALHDHHHGPGAPAAKSQFHTPAHHGTGSSSGGGHGPAHHPPKPPHPPAKPAAPKR